MVVLDLDEKDGKTGIADCQAVASLLGPLPDTPVVTTPTGGRHYYLRAPQRGAKNSQSVNWQGRKTGIDIRAHGGYVVAPGSVIGGKEYAAAHPLPPADELPELPQAWIDGFLPTKRPESPSVAITIPPATSDTVSRCRAYVATMPPAIMRQGGHTALLKVANVIFHGFGLAEAEGWPIMLEYNNRCLPPWDLGDPKEERDFRRKMNQAREKPTSDYPFGHYRDSNRALIANVDISAIEQQCKDVLTNEPCLVFDTETIPEELTHVPGFIDDFIAYCMEAAPHPNRPLAFGCALTLLSFLTLRKVELHGGIHPNLYIITLALSGTGKDYARHVASAILDGAQMGHYIGKDIASAEGVEDKVLNMKKTLLLTDEINNLFEHIAAGHEARYTNVISLLLQMFSSVGGTWHRRIKAAGARDNTPPTCSIPGLVLYGTATPDAFLGALSPKLMISGLGSRCIIMEGEKRSPINHEAKPARMVPQSIIDTADYWRSWIPTDPETGKQNDLYNEYPVPQIVELTPDAQQIGKSYGNLVENYYRHASSELERVLWSRVYEIARKLALLYACSRDKDNLIVDAEAMTWGTKTADWLYRAMMRIVMDKVAENPFDALCQRVLQVIRDHKGRITRKQLIRAVRIKARDLDEALTTLAEQEKIVAQMQDGSTKPTLMYQLVPEA